MLTVSRELAKILTDSIKTINIIFQSQVFEVGQKADPQEEVNINEGTFNSKKWIKLNLMLQM